MSVGSLESLLNMYRKTRLLEADISTSTLATCCFSNLLKVSKF